MMRGNMRRLCENELRDIRVTLTQGVMTVKLHHVGAVLPASLMPLHFFRIAHLVTCMWFKGA